jgi:hypothetical protein
MFPHRYPTPDGRPTPEFDFVITKQRSLTKDETAAVEIRNIYITVIGASPISRVQLGDV